MSDWWFWFTRPLAEFAGSLALVVGLGLFLLVWGTVAALWTWVGLHWVRRKIQDLWSGGDHEVR